MADNADAMALWMAVQTQWRAGGMGVVGLDYAEVRHWAADLGVRLTPGMWGKIKTLERQTLEEIHADDDGSRSGQAAKRPQGRG